MTATGTSAITTLMADADLCQRAAAGDQGAFEELYRRHVQTVWRFAQAVTRTRSEAEVATSEAFTKVLRLVRRGRTTAAEQVRPYLLAAVYRWALDTLRAQGRSGEVTEPANPPEWCDIGPGQQALLGAFRALPERWRAALWLTAVEELTVESVAPILGVSNAVAVQMVRRAQDGITKRFLRSDEARALPDIGGTLGAAALAMPTGLASAALARWRKAMAAERLRIAPKSGWLTERAPRPLLTCAAGLLAAGLIGLGVLGQQVGLGGSAPGGPPAVPLATHQFHGPAGGSLNLVAAVSPLASPTSFAGLLDGIGGFIQGVATTATTGAVPGSPGGAVPGAGGSLGAGGGGGGGAPGGSGGGLLGGGGGLPGGGGGGGGLLGGGGGLLGGGGGGGLLGGGGGAPVPGVPVTVPTQVTLPVPGAPVPPVTVPPVRLPPPPPVTLPRPPVTAPPTTVPRPPVTLPPLPPTTLPTLPPPPPTTLPPLP